MTLYPRLRRARRCSQTRSPYLRKVGRFEKLEVRAVLDGATPWDVAWPEHVPSASGPEGEEPVIGITNGRFEVSNAGDPGFGWERSGDAVVEDGHGVLREADLIFSGFTQTFLIPEGAASLRFSLLSRTLGATLGQPPDAFEVALLDANTFESLVPVVEGLSSSDAFFNLQASGELFFGASTEVTGAAVSGQSPSLTFPVVVTVDLTGVAANTLATLYFDLLAFGALDSEVVLDVVTIVGHDAPPLQAQLAPAANSGSPDDNITNLSPVTIIGTTDPLGSVRLDVDGDGFDDGTATADIHGAFSIANVALQSGPNTLVVRAGVEPAVTDVSFTVTLDQQGPTSALISPAPGTNLTFDQGFVDIQWSDVSGVDVSTFGTDDITITGVTVDRLTVLPNNSVRYFYGDDGDSLPGGAVQVRRVGGQVRDFAGNQSSDQISNFNVALLVNAGRTNAAVFGNSISLIDASFTYPGNHSLLTATIDWGDGNVMPLALPSGTGGGPIAASHTYLDMGVYEVRVTIVDATMLEVSDATSFSIVRNECGWQNPFNPLDVDFDFELVVLDAALIINELNARGIRTFPNPPLPGNVPPLFLDVSCDNELSPLDAQLVVSALNAGVSIGGGEGEPEIWLSETTIDDAPPTASDAASETRESVTASSAKLNTTQGPLADDLARAFALWQHLEQTAARPNVGQQVAEKSDRGLNSGVLDWTSATDLDSGD